MNKESANTTKVEQAKIQENNNNNNSEVLYSDRIKIDNVGFVMTTNFNYENNNKTTNNAAAATTTTTTTTNTNTNINNSNLIKDINDISTKNNTNNNNYYSNLNQISQQLLSNEQVNLKQSNTSNNNNNSNNNIFFNDILYETNKENRIKTGEIQLIKENKSKEQDNNLQHSIDKLLNEYNNKYRYNDSINNTDLKLYNLEEKDDYINKNNCLNINKSIQNTTQTTTRYNQDELKKANRLEIKPYLNLLLEQLEQDKSVLQDEFETNLGNKHHIELDKSLNKDFVSLDNNRMYTSSSSSQQTQAAAATTNNKSASSSSYIGRNTSSVFASTNTNTNNTSKAKGFFEDSNINKSSKQTTSSSSSSSAQAAASSNYNSAAIFHPTWDEWKRSHLSEINATANNNNNNNKHTTTNTSNENYNKSTNKNELLSNNKESIERNQTTRNIVEETYRQKSSHQSKEHYTNNSLLQQEQEKMRHHQLHSNQHNYQKKHLNEDIYNPPSPIVINDSARFNRQNVQQQQQQQHHSTSSQFQNTTKSSPRSPRHYPVYPFDRQPERAPSPVRLSSIVLAKEPPLEVRTEDSKISPPPTPAAEPQQPKKIKTIMTTQKRKDSAPNLTGWRTESDSDTDIQNRLLAKASGSIPIEYISIRRDPKPIEKKEKGKKSITTGTNTCVDRGKRVASTNTNQDELPQYNLHVSLDSLFVKSRREASTSTERKNKNAATETEVQQRDAFTVTDVESEPEQQYVYRKRKSRYTEWETHSNPPEYRLEFLAKSPRTVIRRNYEFKHQYHTHNVYNDDDTDLSDLDQSSLHRRGSSRTATAYFHQEQQVRADDDDKLIFGSGYINRRCGSFPSLFNDSVTRRFVKHSQSANYAPCQQTIMNQQYQMTPLKMSNSCLTNENFNEQLNQFNSRFNEIFSHKLGSLSSSASTKCYQAQPVKTERYYKYSRTTSDHKQNAVPTFGEIFNQRINSSSVCSQQRSPFVEMPITPDSTLGKNAHKREYFSSSSSTANRTAATNNLSCSSQNMAYSSGYNSAQHNQQTLTGGANSSLSSASAINVTHQANNAANNKNNWSYSSTMQEACGFDPMPQVTRNTSHSSSSFQNHLATNNSLSRNQSTSSSSYQANVKGRGFNREEEEEEMFNIPNGIDPDKQFRPIVLQPIMTESTTYNSTSSTPIHNGFARNSQTRRTHNQHSSNSVASSSFEQWPNQQRFHTTTQQTVMN